jgi:putative DNA primase/helicase
MSKVHKTLPFNELGCAKRWALHFGKEYKWVSELNRWFVWRDNIWQSDIDNSHQRTLEKVIELIEEDNEINNLEIHKLTKNMDRDDIKRLKYKRSRTEEEEELHKRLQYAADFGPCHKRLQTHSGTKAILGLARSRPSISLPYNTFDSKGQYLGLKNGILNLNTFDLVTDNPRYLVSKRADVNFDSDAECPNWIAFLNRILPEDPETIEFVQKVVGQALLGTPEKGNLIIFNGAGANGKSTLVDTIKTLLGSYGTVVDSAALDTKSGGNDYHRATLKGSRMAIFNETPKGANLDETFIKSIVDSGEVSAREIYGSPFQFQPVATPIMVTNYLPRISSDYSITRRIKVVPFSYTLKDSEKISGFRQKYLEPELPGILNWAIDGLKKLRKHGLESSQTINETTRNFVRENNRVEIFIEECCTKDCKDKVKLTELRSAYAEWSEVHGFKSVASDRLTQDLRSLHYEVKKSTGGVFWVYGLVLKPKKIEEIVEKYKRRKDY